MNDHQNDVEPNQRAKKNILLLSGYDAASHRYWRELLGEQLAQYQWTQLTLPDRYFAWRVRGNSLSFYKKYSDELRQSYDCIIATSMVDIANLKGLCPALSGVPTLCYFHENQFAYPLGEYTNTADVTREKANRISAQLAAIYSVLCADKIIFNSLFNQQSFFNGAKNLLQKMPDECSPDLLCEIEQRASVIPVPIQCNQSDKLIASGSVDKPLHILWNHRWQQDKQPQIFFDALRLLVKWGCDFRLHIVGQSFRQVPECFEIAREEFSEQIESWGFKEKTNYHTILHKADMVVSSAAHDFQGISMLEAMAAGCIPIAPNRMAYPEYVPKKQLYSVSGDGLNSESIESMNLAKQLNFWLDVWQNCRSGDLNQRQKLVNLVNDAKIAANVSAQRYGVNQVIPVYSELIKDVLTSRQSMP